MSVGPIFVTSALRPLRWRPSCYVGVVGENMCGIFVLSIADAVDGFPMGEQGRETRLTVFYPVSLFLSPINPLETQPAFFSLETEVVVRWRRPALGLVGAAPLLTLILLEDPLEIDFDIQGYAQRDACLLLVVNFFTSCYKTVGFCGA